MAVSRPHPSFLWTDPRAQALPLSLKRTLEYCWTGPDVNGIGVTLFEPGVWQARIGEISAAIETCLRQLEAADQVIFDEETREVFVTRWFSFHKFPEKSPAAKAAFRKGWGDLRSQKIRIEVSRLASLTIPTAWLTF